MIHENYNVSDLDRSIKFYGDALDLHEARWKTTDDFIIVYLSNDSSDFELELTWLKEHPQPYDLGECEFHLAFKADDFDLAHKKHEEMGCICFENPEMGIYFIEDPDGYWLEILPWLSYTIIKRGFKKTVWKKMAARTPKGDACSRFFGIIELWKTNITNKDTIHHISWNYHWKFQK